MSNNQTSLIGTLARGLVVALALAVSAATARAAVGDADTVRVNSVVVAPTVSLDAAEAAAKRQALERVVAMRGNKQLRDADVARIMADVDEIVSTRHVLNAAPVNGRYQPAFYFTVHMDRINEVIEETNVAELTTMGSPRIQVAIVIRRLPKKFGDPTDREVYIDDLNETVKEYYGRAGFSLVDFLNFDAEKLYSINSLRKLEKEIFNPLNPPTAIDFYLLGQLDIPNDSVTARDGGAYWRTNAKLQLKLIDLNSGQPVSSSRTVEGTGSTARESVDDALHNIVKAVEQKVNGPDILKTWNRNIARGMKYEVTFCEKALKYAYYDDFTRAMAGYGKLSGGKSDQVPLYVFQFPGGKFLDPAKEFENILEAIKGSSGKYGDTSVKPIIYNKHKVFMFGNSPDCFGGGTRNAVQ